MLPHIQAVGFALSSINSTKFFTSIVVGRLPCILALKELKIPKDTKANEGIQTKMLMCISFDRKNAADTSRAPMPNVHSAFLSRDVKISLISWYFFSAYSSAGL